MIATYFLDNSLSWTTSSRRWRLRLPVLWLSRCFLPARWRLSLPEAVTRKRLREALWVFILGMVHRWSRPGQGASARRPAATKQKEPRVQTRRPGRSGSSCHPPEMGIIVQERPAVVQGENRALLLRLRGEHGRHALAFHRRWFFDLGHVNQ